MYRHVLILWICIFQLGLFLVVSFHLKSLPKLLNLTRLRLAKDSLLVLQFAAPEGKYLFKFLYYSGKENSFFIARAAIYYVSSQTSYEKSSEVIEQQFSYKIFIK